MNGSMDDIAMVAMGMQGYQQNWTYLAVEIASRGLPSIKLATYKLSLWGEPL